MAPKPRDQISLTLGENAAYEKIQRGLKWAIEGCAELATYRSDGRWTQITVILEKVLINVGHLANNAATKAVKGFLLS